MEFKERIRIFRVVMLILTSIFVVAKLTNHIDWNWFWVLLPSILSLIFTTKAVISIKIKSVRKAKKSKLKNK